MPNDRDLMLQRVRQAIAQSRELLKYEAQPALAAIAFPDHVLPQHESLVSQFAAELRKLNGSVSCCTGHAEAREVLRQILRQLQASRVLAWDSEAIGLEGLAQLLADEQVTLVNDRVVGEGRAAQLQALEPIPLCISGVDAAVAESGTILLVAGKGRGRLASLLAPTHVAVLPASRLRPGLAGALALLRERFGTQFLQRHSNLALITGPSRTADIELSLTLGVHGPKEIHVIVLNNA